MLLLDSSHKKFAASLALNSSHPKGWCMEAIPDNLHQNKVLHLFCFFEKKAMQGRECLVHEIMAAPGSRLSLLEWMRKSGGVPGRSRPLQGGMGSQTADLAGQI